MIAEHSIAELALGEFPDEAYVPVASTLFLEKRPVMIVGNDFFRADMGESFGGTAIVTLLERVGWTIEGTNRDGTIRNNPSSVKLLREIWPVMRGTPGTVVQIYAGAQARTTEDPVVWQGPYLFVLGATVSVRPLIEGTYLAIRITSNGQPPWSLLTLDLDIEPTGEPSS